MSETETRTPTSAVVLPRRIQAPDPDGHRGEVDDWFAADAPLYSGRVRETEFLQNPHVQDGWSYAAIEFYAISMSLLGLRVFDGPGEKGQEIEEGPVVDLVEMWDDETTQEEALYQLGQYAMLEGEAFIILADRKGEGVRVLGGEPRPVIGFPQQLVIRRGGIGRAKRVMSSRTGFIRKWEFRRDPGEERVSVRGERNFEAPAVIQYRRHNPDLPSRGRGPAQAAWRALAQRFEAWVHAQYTLRHAGGGDQTIMYERRLTRTELRRKQEEVKEAYDNPRRAGSTLILHDGAKVESGGQSNRDMEFQGLNETNRQEALAAYRTPESLLGLKSANYAEFQGHLRVFVDLVLRPDANRIAKLLTHRVFRRQRDPALTRYELRVDYSVLEAMTEDLKAKVEQARELQRMGVPLNSAAKLAKIDIDPIDGGDVALVLGSWKRLQDIVDEPDPQPATPPPPPAPPGAQPDEEQPPAEQQEEEEPAEDGPRSRSARAASTTSGRSIAQRRSLVSALDQVTDRVESWTASKLRGVFFRMRRAQIDALREASAKAAPVEPRGWTRRGEVLAGACTALVGAWREDAAEARRLAETEPERLVRAVHSCCGDHLYDEPVEWSPRQLDVLARDPRLARIGLSRARELATLRDLDLLSDAEFESLLTVQEQRWAAAIAEVLEQSYARAWEASSADMAARFGFVELPTNPETLRYFQEKAIRVAEGVQSTIASRVRSAIVRGLADSETVGGLAERLRADVDQLTKETGRQFRMTARRSLTIARTEVAQGSSLERHLQLVQAARAGAISAREWGTANSGRADQGRVREAHWQMDGEVAALVPEDVPWTVPGTDDESPAVLAYPAEEGGPPEQIINCRCKELPVV